jgi:hypothetical protein
VAAIALRGPAREPSVEAAQPRQARFAD